MNAQHRSSIFELLRQRISGPKKVELPVSAYGKLPIYKDFLRHGLAAPEAQALKRWLDRGVSKFWATYDAYREQEIPPQALLLSFPATGRQVLGYLWGSHDHGALRRFPFVLFVSLPVARTAAQLTMIDALAQVVEQAAALRRQLAGLPDVDAFYPLIRTAKIHLLLRGDKALREELAAAKVTVGELGKALYGEQVELLWPALLGRLRRAATDKRSSFAGRLPLADILPVAQLTALWCLLLEGARRNSSKPQQLIYAPRDPGAGVTVLHRDLQPDDVFAFHPEMPDYEGIEDLRRTVPTNTSLALGPDRCARPIAALLDKGFV